MLFNKMEEIFIFKKYIGISQEFNPLYIKASRVLKERGGSFNMLSQEKLLKLGEKIKRLSFTSSFIIFWVIRDCFLKENVFCIIFRYWNFIIDYWVSN